jgi:peptide/nickel transport system ATP-binding protein
MNRPTAAAYPALDLSRSAQDDALTVIGLSVAYRTHERVRPVLQDVSLRVKRGEAYGLVGESGCGKSTLALAALRYLPRNGALQAGRVLIGGHDVHALDAGALRTLRARTVSMVYQDPGRALNPTLTIGRQVAEAFEAAGERRADAIVHAHDMLLRMRIGDPARVMHSYPHQISGGMQQRAVIAMALASNPTLLILDEPTTGLDATVEAQVLDLIAQLRAELGTAVLFVSHNLAVIARMCERVGVLYAGRLIEEGASADVFDAPRHPYTVGLLRCLPGARSDKTRARLDTIAGELPAAGLALPGCLYAPRCGLADERCRRDTPPPARIAAAHGEQMARCHHHERAHTLPRTSPAAAAARDDTQAPPIARPFAPVLRIERVSKTFDASGPALRALDDVSLELAAGETLGLVGESGSGKTTLAKLLLGLLAPDAGGVIALDGAPLAARVTRRTRAQIVALQSVFQNPDAALNRALAVKRLIGRPLARLAGLRGTARTARLAELAEAVRLPGRYLDVRTRHLSGGLKQRVAIARAFAGAPRVIVCDEPTSALDVSVQAAILNLLADLQRARGVSYLFISHDLNVVRYLSDRIAVLYGGRLLEIGPAARVFDGPHHPYTEVLLSAMPVSDSPLPERIRMTDEPVASSTTSSATSSAAASTSVSGCIFHPRCPRKLGARCETDDPPFADAAPGHRIRCHIPIDELRRLQRQRTGGARNR